MSANKRVRKYKSAGGIVLNDAGQVLLLERHVTREDTPNYEIRLPKGHIKKKETAEEAALREVGEESGYWGLEIVADLGKSKVEFEFRGQRIRRKERYFLMRLTDPVHGEPQPSSPDAEEALFEPLWADDLAQAEQLLTFEAEKEFVRRARAWVEDNGSC
ncbi:MAG TPA: NUDIX domain-containing protein [Caldilineae bacterium]|nr:NUDIX domain-containing protein [Caldilineae bacterium]